jgi:hypothetical protein
MASTLRSRFRRLVDEHVTPLLEAHGFRASRDFFRRQTEGMWSVIDVQKSRWNSPEEARFTLNAGLYVPGVLNTYASRPEPTQPGPGDCCVSARVGMLMPSQKDTWWRVSLEDPDADRVVGQEMVEACRHYLLPFLARFVSVLDVARFLEQEDSRYRYVLPRDRAIRLAYAAIIYHRIGMSPHAMATLDQAVAVARAPLREHMAVLSTRLR